MYVYGHNHHREYGLRAFGDVMKQIQPARGQNLHTLQKNPKGCLLCETHQASQEGKAAVNLIDYVAFLCFANKQTLIFQ